MISNTDLVLGNDVFLVAAPDPPEVKHTIYMCMGILCALRDSVLKRYADEPDMLSGFNAFITDIDKQMRLQIQDEYSVMSHWNSVQH